MTLQLLKKVALGVAMLLSQTIISQVQDSEETLNQKYWNLRERFRKYYVSLGKDKGQGIPVAKRQIGSYGGNRCSNLYGSSSGWMSWGDATSYLGDYMCTLATEYALLVQEGKGTAATLNELYYALNALDRLDGFAEPTFSNNNLPPTYNGFFLRDDVEQSTVTKWNYEYDNVGVQDPLLNYRCVTTDHLSNLNDDLFLNPQGQVVPRGNSATNEPSFDQISNILTGFSFIKKYVPNVYVKPTSTDVGFNIIDKIQAITVRLMDYMSGADRQLQRADHTSELMFNVIAHPTPSIFGPGTPLAFTHNSALGYLIADSDCGNNDIRGNWILVNPVTGRKVGVESNDTKGQDIRLFAHTFAKIAEKLTGDNQYFGRSIHHQSIDHSGDQYYCLSKHDYHIPLSVVSLAWDMLQNMTTVPEDLVFSIGPPNNPGSPFKNTIAIELSSLPRNFYIFECLGSTSGTWSHVNVNKFASYYGHENIDLIYSCLNDETPLISQQHYIDLLSKMPCDGNRNYGPNDFTPFWNNGNSFEHTTYDTDGYSHGEYNANDWMWLYNMYRLKFGGNGFPSYEDVSCNCKKSPTLEANTNSVTGELNTSIILKRVFKDYLKLGISLKEFNQGSLYIQNNKTLTNETEFTICGNVYISGNGTLINTGKPTTEDSIKITVRNGSGIFVQTNGTLDVGKNTKVVIQKLGKLVSSGTNAKIIIRNGGKLIIEPGAFLELNNGGKLIVEDGGLVIIHTKIAAGGNSSENGVLTYNQGAEIQLKGNNAVLELNGRLHIGDNATFGITYPGSNSGYIKFNRGAGVWWDNWATNNAHITCGINSKISLIGQNKTDKMIDISQDNVAIPKNLTQFVMSKCLVEFNVGNARLETDRPTIITNSTFKGNYTPLSNQSDYTRGLLVFGQPVCIINGCDFRDLGSGITGALFYGGNKLTGVKNCNFYNIGGIITYGGGVNISNNYLSGAAIQIVDASFNSLISNNTITKYNQNTTYEPGGIGIVVDGANVEFDIRKNSINNLEYALMTAAGNVKLSCNDLQNNQIGLFAGVDSKINMSSALGAGFNNAANCEKFAHLYETNLFEANDGYNNFKITDDVPCTWIPQSGHVPYIIPGHWDCPTIIEGSLINFSGQNATSGVYENFAEYNFWRPLVSPTDVIEDRQNKIRKLTYTTDPNNPTLDSASIITNNFLNNTNQVNCPTNGNGVNTTHFKPHPLDINSNSSVISTASFYNKTVQEALQLSLSKMDKMQNSMKVNEAADLFTEILKYNYSSPLTNSADKYLLELAYQKLYTCVAQLVEWHKDTATNFLPLPLSLNNRVNDLHLICALRIGRKSITEADYKEINHLILLDKACIYRLTNDYSNALSIINFITSNFPKAQHLNSFENYKCIWNTEFEALNGNITTDEALIRLASCQKAYNIYPKQNSLSSRKSIVSKNSEVEYAEGYEIVIYPNPANNTLMIGYNLSEFKKVTFEIYDVQGKCISLYNLNSDARKFDIDNLNLQNGIYFYIIKGDEKILMNKKLVVIK